MSSENAIIIALVTCVIGALVTLLAAPQKKLAGWLAFITTAIAGMFVWYAAGRVLLFGPGQAVTYWALPQFAFALRIYVDGLSALFLILIMTIAIPAVFFSIDYMTQYRDYGVRRYYPNLLLFIAAMCGIVTTTDTMFFFFIFWQLMTLTSYSLVRYEYGKPENIRAANKYLLMMQLACGLTMIGAWLLAGESVQMGNETLMKYDFDAISHYLPQLFAEKSRWVTVAFALFLLGFGIKVGLWPLGQIWLPDAHPAAPSPVSALLSGVMIKTGVYGLMRYFLWFVPRGLAQDYPSANWGWVIAILGTITLFVGTMQALQQEQAKRLLAFHSIGQMGYILLGLGACLALLQTNQITLAAIAFYGAMFHTFNHGLFKSLLFLNAGSMQFATGTQNLNKIGGLMKYMPATALTALIASCSISGVPLFNGFASKWSIYAATIQGGTSARYLPICAVIAILTSALTLASFIKFFGVSFLARTSSLVSDKAAHQSSIEVGWRMRLPQYVLAVFCLMLGLFPILACDLIQWAMHSSRQGLGAALADAFAVRGGLWTGLDFLQGGAVFRPLGLLLVLGLMFLLAYGLAKLGGARRKSAIPWLCGYAQEADCHRYYTHQFYSEIKRHFRWLGGAPRASLAGKVKPPIQPKNPPLAGERSDHARP